MNTERIFFASAGAKRRPRTYLEIAADYAPYHTMKEFEEGATAYLERRYDSPYNAPGDGLKAQAWDRGLEAAMRFTRQHGGC